MYQAQWAADVHGLQSPRPVIAQRQEPRARTVTAVERGRRGLSTAEHQPVSLLSSGLIAQKCLGSQLGSMQMRLGVLPAGGSAPVYFEPRARTWPRAPPRRGRCAVCRRSSSVLNAVCKAQPFGLRTQPGGLAASVRKLLLLFNPHSLSPSAAFLSPPNPLSA